VAITALMVGVFLITAALLLAPWLAASDRRFATAVSLCLLAIGGWFYAWQWTDLALRTISWHDVIFFDRLPLYVAIILLLAVCRQRIERNTTRVLIATVVAIFGLYALAEMSAGVLLPLFADQLSAEVSGPPEVLQSTGWSCGAAALAWAAREAGCDVSERQMAELAVTAPLRGTRTRGMLRALDAIGLEATVRRNATWQQLRAAPKPVLAGWKLSRTVGHAVVVLETTDTHVRVGDPLTGEMEYGRQDFLDGWDGEMIVIRRPAGT